MGYSAFKRTACALMLVVSGGPSAWAAEASATVLAPGDFGLSQGLRWGMSAAEARQALPDLAVAPDPGPVDPRLAGVGTAAVGYVGCALDFTLRFFKDQLDQIQVRTQDGQTCHEAIERNLTAHYRDPRLPAACPNIVSRQWKLPGTTTSYYYDCATARAGMTIQFSEVSDLSGRLAEANRNKDCQLITADILAATDADGASDPVLSPDLPDLGCDYPPISTRLQESGSPELRVRVAADGSVADAQVLAPSGKVRLDNGALAIARQKLKFVPAMRDGKPVEAVRPVRINFKIIHFISGIVDVLYRCSDGSSSFALPCYGPFPALTAAPAARGAKLTVRSSDLKKDAPLSADLTFAGANESPALNWSAGPRGTESYVLIAEDSGVATPTRQDPRIFWMVLNIPPSARTLPRGVPPDLKIANPAGAMNIRGPFGNFGYYGYTGRPVHFQIFALDTRLALDPLTVARAALLRAMKDHVLASGEVVANENGK